MKILFVTSTRIGDAVLSTGLLAHLIESHPDSRITVACGPAAAPLFAATPNVERVIALAKRAAGGHWFALWRACATTLWDLVVDLRASMIAYLLPARRRLVLQTRGDAGHRVEGLGRLMALDPPPAPRLWSSPEQAAEAGRLLPGGGPVLAVGPTAKWPGKQWRAERFGELAQRLTAPGGILPAARIAIFGGPGEREAALPMIDSVPEERRIDFVGALDLLTAHACLKRASLYVGNDSGLMHIAAAAGCPTLGLFGPSRENHYAPWGPRAAFVRTERAYDELVGGAGYDHRSVDSLMDSLSVEVACAAAEALWARAGGSPS